MSPVMAIYFPLETVLAIIFLAASASIAEALIIGYSYKGEISLVIKYRAIKQILPNVMALIFSIIYKDFRISVSALAAGFLISLIILVFPIRHKIGISVKGMLDTVGKHSNGIRASLMLGTLNAVWSYGLLPLMSAMGLSATAGQYAIVQRLINSPLGVIGVSVNSTLLKSGSRFHENSREIIEKVGLLFFIAVALAGVLYWIIYIQRFIPFPDNWRLDKVFFFAAAFFFVCSFAVGTVSVLSVRLKDEWFLARWQLAFVIIWGIILIYFRSSWAFVFMLIIGGLGYWILIARWVGLSRMKYG